MTACTKTPPGSCRPHKTYQMAWITLTRCMIHAICEYPEGRGPGGKTGQAGYPTKGRRPNSARTGEPPFLRQSRERETLGPHGALRAAALPSAVLFRFIIAAQAEHYDRFFPDLRRHGIIGPVLPLFGRVLEFPAVVPQVRESCQRAPPPRWTCPRRASARA